jgi:hypothetical protein
VILQNHGLFYALLYGVKNSRFALPLTAIFFSNSQPNTNLTLEKKTLSKVPLTRHGQEWRFVETVGAPVFSSDVIDDADEGELVSFVTGIHDSRSISVTVILPSQTLSNVIIQGFLDTARRDHERICISKVSKRKKLRR